MSVQCSLAVRQYKTTQNVLKRKGSTSTIYIYIYFYIITINGNPLWLSLAQWEKHILLSLSIKSFQPNLGIYMILNLNAIPLVPTIFFNILKILRNPAGSTTENARTTVTESCAWWNKQKPPEATMTEKLQNCTKQHGNVVSSIHPSYIIKIKR